MFPRYEVYYLLGNALVQLGQVEEGIKVFEELVAKPAVKKEDIGCQ